MVAPPTQQEIARLTAFRMLLINEVWKLRHPDEPMPGCVDIEPLRAQLSGWHFAKEAMSARELAILHVAEQLMAELDKLT